MTHAQHLLRPLWIGGLTLALLLSGCAAVKVVARGETVVDQRVSVQVDRPWNQLGGHLVEVPTWTHEGITVDALQFYIGIKDGQDLPAPAAKGTAPLTFKSSMQASDVVALFQAKLTRDGSSFQLDRLEPSTFLGTQGFRFEYSLNRKSDDVPMKGVAVAAIRQGELFVMHYTAPRLVFFPRHLGAFESLVKSAAIKG